MKKLLTLSLLAYTLSAQQYTVDQLIKEALHNSPDIAIAKLTEESSTKNYDIAYSNYLPKIDLHTNISKVGLQQNDQTPHEDDTLLSGSLTLSQILYDFGKTSSMVKSSHSLVQATSMQTQQSILNKKRDVKEAYYQVLKAKALIDVQKENLTLNKAQRYRAQKYYEAGIRTKIDVSDAEVGVVQAKIALNNAQYDTQLTFTNLDKVVGFKQIEHTYTLYTQPFSMKENVALITPYDLTLHEAIHYANTHRCEVQQQKYTIDYRNEKIKQTQAGYYPNLLLIADYTRQDVEKLQTVFPQEQWNFGVNLNWNLYQGGATKAATQEKKIQMQIATKEHTNLLLRIKKEVTDAYITLQKRKDTLELSQTLVDVSHEKFIQASKRYEHGLSDFIELQQARQGYIDAKAQLVIAYYDYYIAQAYLDNAIGR